MGSVEKRLDISLNTELQVPSVLSTDFWLAVTAQVKRGREEGGREAGAQIWRGLGGNLVYCNALQQLCCLETAV